MIETIIKRKEKSVGFPKLMKSIKYDNYIIFFIEPCKGIVVSSPIYPADLNKIGDFSSEWNMNAFEDYEGCVILQNISVEKDCYE